jgi:lysozyme family protein
MANYLLIVPFIKKWERGLSKAKTDRASKDPVPDGSGWHTNKGVTWATFRDLAPKLGYLATPTLFYEMPDWLWMKIWKRAYWDAVGGDYLKSQALADLMADFAWASGPGTAVRELQQVLQALGHKSLADDGQIGPKTLTAINSTSERKLFDSMAWQREAYIKSLKDPNNEKGWLNRLNDLVQLKKKILPREGSESLPAPSSPTVSTGPSKKNKTQKTL